MVIFDSIMQIYRFTPKYTENGYLQFQNENDSFYSVVGRPWHDKHWHAIVARGLFLDMRVLYSSGTEMRRVLGLSNWHAKSLISPLAVSEGGWSI